MVDNSSVNEYYCPYLMDGGTVVKKLPFPIPQPKEEGKETKDPTWECTLSFCCP